MIDSINLTPQIYSKESRDFQLFCRLYNIIFNYLKTGTDLIGTIKDSKLLELLVRTLGFEPKRKYSQEELYAVSQSFSTIMKNKGSLYGIELAVKTALRTTRKKDYYIEIDKNEVNNLSSLTIYLNDSVGNSEICLLEELLDYIAPINSSYVIKQVKKEEARSQGIFVKEDYSTGNLSQKYTSTLADNGNDYIQDKVTDKKVSKDFTEISNKDKSILGDLALGVITDEINKGKK